MENFIGKTAEDVGFSKVTFNGSENKMSCLEKAGHIACILPGAQQVIGALQIIWNIFKCIGQLFIDIKNQENKLCDEVGPKAGWSMIEGFARMVPIVGTIYSIRALCTGRSLTNKQLKKSINNK